MAQTQKSCLRKALVGFMGVVAFSLLAAPGSAFLLTPAREHARPHWLRVAPLSSLPSDGSPLRFRIVRPQRDAWTVHLDRVVGQVFLRVSPRSGRVMALETYHLFNGYWIGVVYDEQNKVFRSVCRKVLFDLDGKLLDDDPTIREVCSDMRQLNLRIEGNEVLVESEMPAGTP